MAQITITLTKSPIGRIPVQRRTVKALGLGKLGSSVVKTDTPAVRGMAASIAHLVTVTDGAEKSAPKTTKSAVKPAAAKAPVDEKKPASQKASTAKKSPAEAEATTAAKKPATAKASAKKPAEKKPAKAGAGKPDSSSKVAEIKAYLDAEGIKYASTAKKADLLELVK